METHASGIPGENIQHCACSVHIIIEGPVQHPDIPYAVDADIGEPFTDLSEALASDGLLSAAYAECACIETASGRLQLHEGLVPAEEGTLLGILQRRKVRHSRRSIVMV